MMTWAMFLGEDVAEKLIRIRSTAISLSASLHAIMVLAAVELPRLPGTTTESGIDVTLEFAPRSQDGSMVALLADEPAPVDPAAPSDSLQPSPEPEVVHEPQSAASEAPSLPAPPQLEQAVVAVEAPPDVDRRDFARATPLEELVPPAETPPAVGAHELVAARPATDGKAARQPPMQATALPAPSPKRSVPEAKPGDSLGAARHSPSVALKSDAAQRKSHEDYFWQIVRKISQYRFYSKQQQTAEQGLVVTRMTIARDGRLLALSLVKSSGFPNLDGAVLDTIRQASPFAPLPSELAEEQQTFTVPVSYTRER